jgi:hypothetical protein
MRRKVIQHYADMLCHMAIGWRMGDDLEILSELPDGTIHINLLTGVATHSVANEINLWIAGEMRAWLRNRFATDKIPEQQILRAEVCLSSKTDRISTDRKRIVSFDWHCSSLISTDEKTYEGQLNEGHTWHNRTQNTSKP